jgi:hypothetical protein
MLTKYGKSDKMNMRDRAVQFTADYEDATVEKYRLVSMELASRCETALLPLKER